MVGCYNRHNPSRIALAKRSNEHGSFKTLRWKNLSQERDTDDATFLPGADSGLGNDEFEWQSNEIAEPSMEHKTQ